MSPQTSYVKTLPAQCDGIRRRGLWEAIRVIRGHESSHHAIHALVRVPRELASSLLCQVRLQQEADSPQPGRGSSSDTDHTGT